MNKLKAILTLLLCVVLLSLGVCAENGQDGGVTNVLRVESFNVAEASENGTINVLFSAYSDADIEYSYKISAVVDKMGEEKELLSGNARVGKNVEGELKLSKLSTYGEYILKLHVWYNTGSADIFDYAFSDAFSYVNVQVDANERDFFVTVLPDSHMLEVSWDGEALGEEARIVKAALFENDDSEPVAFKDCLLFEGKTQFAYDPSAEKLRVEFTVNYDGVNASPLYKEIDIAKAPFSIPEGNAFNFLTFPVEFVSTPGTVLDISVNSEVMEKELSESGILEVELCDGMNNFFAVAQNEQSGITWRVQREIYVERIAPTLTMSKNYDGVTTDFRTITVSGMAADCESVTINDIPSKLDSNGMFSLDVPLEKGRNVITVKASDSFGNQTLYTATVKCGKLNANSIESKINADKEQKMNFDEVLVADGSYLGLAISGVLCALVIVYAVLFWRKEGK